MQTHLSAEFEGTPDGTAAAAVLRNCVHCGFCTATCPTYQLLGDELDGPRGRIDLIKQVLEGGEPTRKTQLHLDRCLTCRNCETTCPSGVQYGRLVEIGRRIVDAKVPRPAVERGVRWMLKEGLPSPAFAPALRVGQALRPLLPAALKSKVPAHQAIDRGSSPRRAHGRRMLALGGCVQPAMRPNIDIATARVLDACGIELVQADGAGCCGAIRGHLGDAAGAAADVRRNIDAWWPAVVSDAVEAIVVNASGCAAFTKEAAHLVEDDPAYADKARRLFGMTTDLSALLPSLLPQLQGVVRPSAGTLVVHPPCTLQHHQKVRGSVEQSLAALGYDVRLAVAESHLCCGSAGTYSVLQPKLAGALRDRKLEGLAATAGDTIVSANIGCITHLQSGTTTPVRHWVEVLADDLRD